MENEKKSPRFGLRLSAIVVAVLLVICMAVPAFAYGSLPDDVVAPGNWYEDYFIIRATVNNKPGYRLYSLDGVSYIELRSNSDSYDYCFNGRDSFGHYYYSTLPDWTYWSKSSSQSWLISLSSPIEIVYCTMDVTFDGNKIRFTEPPPPDPLGEVGSGLTVVLDWVGATVSALFSGELSGLLPLVAIPVAITILIVAIVVIKRSIWGA